MKKAMNSNIVIDQNGKRKQVLSVITLGFG